MPLFSAMDVQVLNEIFGGVNYTPAATLYFGFSTTAPAKDATNITEPSGNGYQRVAVTNNTTNFPSAATTSGQSAKFNGTIIQFPTATGSWGTPGYWVVFTDPTATTNPVAYGVIQTPKAVQTGDSPSFIVNGFEITMQ